MAQPINKLPSIKEIADWTEKFVRDHIDHEYIERIKKWDWRVITICFMTAFTFWIFQSLNAENTADVELPVQVSYAQENIIEMSEPPSSITVNITGNGWALLSKSLGLGGDVIRLNLENPVGVKYVKTSTLMPEISQIFKNVKINFLQEDSIFFHYDSLTNKMVSVVLDTSSIVYEVGYRRVSDYYLSPDTVTLTGPSTHLENIHPVKVIDLFEYIPIGESFDRMLEIEFPEEEHTSVNFDEINVSFDVAYFTKVEREAYIKLLNSPDSSWTLESPTVMTSFVINESELENHEDTLWVMADFEKFNKKDSTILLQVEWDSIFEKPQVLTPVIKVLKVTP